MKILWNPWRSEYIRRFTEKTESEECLFCRLQKLREEEALIVYKGKYAFVVMNAYPYNTGHLMIAPYRHVPDLTELEEPELEELINLVKKVVRVLREAFRPDGFNIGANIGRAAGAGVPDHFHVHVVPRWVGDTNFMAVISGTKPLPVALNEAYSTIKTYWSTV
ncbi:MAG: HIT family protein [Desulfurococcaceae archaeon]|jgi:ATP adenylyltransferase